LNEIQSFLNLYRFLFCIHNTTLTPNSLHKWFIICVLIFALYEPLASWLIVQVSIWKKCDSLQESSQALRWVLFLYCLWRTNSWDFFKHASNKYCSYIAFLFCTCPIVMVLGLRISVARDVLPLMDFSMLGILMKWRPLKIENSQPEDKFYIDRMIKILNEYTRCST